MDHANKNNELARRAARLAKKYLHTPTTMTPPNCNKSMLYCIVNLPERIKAV